MKIDYHQFNKLKPGVGIIWLQLASGVVWLGVGMMLMGFASGWLRMDVDFTRYLFLASGIMLAAGTYYFGFSKLARKNIERVDELKGKKVCFFAFQTWKNYPLVAFMVSLGIYLRLYSPIPKPLLAILYLGIGGGLLAASFHYFVHIAREVRLHPAGER